MVNKRIKEKKMGKIRMVFHFKMGIAKIYLKITNMIKIIGKRINSKIKVKIHKIVN